MKRVPVYVADLYALACVGLLHNGIQNSKRFERAQSRSSDGDACAIHPPFGVKVNQVDFHALFAKRDGR